MTHDSIQDELTKEKSLWDIYVASRKIVSTPFNKISTVLIFIILSINVTVTPQPINEILDIVRSFAYTGISVTISTLGFLVAGFTIFATITQPTLSLAMAKYEDKKSGLSLLKKNYFIFIRVFIYYLVYAGFCFLILTFGHKGGIVSLLVNYFSDNGIVKSTLVKVSYVLIFTGFFFLIIQLKSFVFNIYHSVMTSLRWEAMSQGESPKEQKPPHKIS